MSRFTSVADESGTALFSAFIRNVKFQSVRYTCLFVFLQVIGIRMRTL